MSRTPIIAGNWKMFKTVSEAVSFFEAVKGKAEVAGVESVICAPFTALPALVEAGKGTSIAIGAQNLHFEDNGAYTGEISGVMLKDLGVKYVIIGHSERRQYFAETDETVNKKIQAALAAGLIPIVCVGESLAQNEAGETHAFVSGQVKAALAGLSGDQVQGLIIAYEPIWAIGTGKAATAQQAQQICGDTVRATIAELY